MMEEEYKKLLEIAKIAAQEAGEKIINIYNTGDFGVEAKSDSSPLTLADMASHNVILSHLEKTGLPVLSEEGNQITFEEREKWETFWMIDPLDGTKEFVKKNGEFTVNIALISKNKVVLGVVYTPVLKDLYSAFTGNGAFKNGTNIKVNTFSKEESELRIVASRSHLNIETETFIKKFDSPKTVSKGSSLKLLMIAEGAADLYPRFAPTMEWDTAAAQIIVEEAGGSVLIGESKIRVHYNKPDLLNPYFLVCGNIQ